MLRWVQDVNLREYKHNWEIRDAASVMPMDKYLMRRRLQWYGQVSRKEETNATIAQHDSTRGRVERKTTIKMSEYHQEGHETEWNGEGCP